MIKLSDIVSEFMDKRSNDPVLLKKISKELDQVTRYMKKKKYIPNAKFNVKGSGMEMRGWKDNVNNYLIKVIGKTDRKGNISYPTISIPQFFVMINTFNFNACCCSYKTISNSSIICSNNTYCL